MAISEEFASKVAGISHDQDKLIQLINDLDEEKRLARSFQRNWSNSEKEEGGLSGSQRSKKLRKLKDKVSFLIEEREYARMQLKKLNSEKKKLNQAINKKAGFAEAFYVAAELNLPEDVFLKLELNAYQLLKQNKKR